MRCIKAGILFVAVGAQCVCHAQGLYNDSVGDFRTGGLGQGVLPVDVAAQSVYFDEATWAFTTEFAPAQSIKLANESGSAAPLLGFVGLDIGDGNELGSSLLDNNRSLLDLTSSGMEVDLLFDLSSVQEHPGMISLIDAVTSEEVTQVSISRQGQRVSWQLNRNLLPETLGGIKFSSVFGDDAGITDAIVDTGYGIAAPVPEPSSMCVLTFGAWCLWWRRKRA